MRLHDNPNTCVCGAKNGCTRAANGSIGHVGPRIPRADWSRYDRLVELYGEKCGMCGTSWHLVIDHVIPRGRGGSDRFENLGLLCKSCNTAKGAKSSFDYRVPLKVAPSGDPA